MPNWHFIIPFKNLINEAYCRDISVKIRSQLEIKRKNGQFLGSFAAFGYLKDEQNKNKLVVDQYAADIVRDIFKWKLEGVSPQDIADALNKLGVLSPMEYKRSLGMKFTTSFKTNAKATWSAGTVIRILKNPIYSGVLVQGKETSARYLISHGLDPSLVCQSKSIPYWHIDLMARDVFRMVWKDRKEAVLLTYQMLEECATKDSETYINALSSKEAQLEKLQKSLERLRRMCAMGDITREEFLSDSTAIRNEISVLELQIKDLHMTAEQQSTAFSLDFARIRETLDRWIDFSGPTISDALIEQFILQVVLIDDDTFNWTLDLSSDKKEKLPTASQIALDLYRQQQGASSGVPMDSMLRSHITDPHELFSFIVSADEAAAYCQSIGMKFFRKKWHDKKIIVSI